MKDWLGLGKVEKDLNESLNFDTSEKKSKKRRSRKNEKYEKILNKNQAADAKKVIAETKKTVNAFRKIVTKNTIPNNLDDAKKMKERLEKEELDHFELLETKEKIKLLKKKIKERKAKERKTRLGKIKRSLKFYRGVIRGD